MQSPPQGLFEDEAGEPSLQLDIAGGVPTSSRRLPPADPLAEPQGSDPCSTPSAKAQPEIVLDPYEVAVFANFGSVPSSIWRCPAYAIRVLLRSRELGRMLRDAQRRAEVAVQYRDDCLAFIAERSRPLLDEDREMSRYLEPLVRCERIARDREASLANRSQQYASAVGAIDQRIAYEESCASSLKERVNAARVEHAGKSQVLSRAQAQLRRAEIELRNAQEVARAAAGPNAKSAPPEHAHAIISAQNQVEERRRELAQPQLEADAARHTLADLERPLQEVEKRIQALRLERQRSEAAFSREAGLRSEGVEQAKSERRLALIQIGARLFETSSPMLSEEQYEVFNRARSEVVRCQIAVERILRALSCVNRAAVKRGWILISAGAALVLLLIATLLVRLPS